MALKGIKKLGIIAGDGSLPRHVYDACIESKTDVVVIGLDHETNYEIFADVEVSRFPVYKVSKILKKLKDENVSHVTLAGKVKRADIPRLLLDIKGAKLFAQIVKYGLADNSILQTIIRFIEKEGFEIIAPEKVANEIVLGKGALTKAKPNKAALSDIKQGLKVLKGIATFDVGQSLVIQNGLVLGVEAAEGTDELLKRCGEIKQSGDGPILIKISKPKQDRRVDLPCIGPETIKNAAMYGFKGVAAEAGSALILDEVSTIKLANQNKIFIVGV